ncbi:Protein FAR-RED IMPAIRED RESPONSE 1 [Bienertia sinuspersici]
MRFNLQTEKSKLEKARISNGRKGWRWRREQQQPDESDRWEEDEDKAMDCDGVVGGDDAVDDVNGGIECDEVYQEGSDVCDNGTQREAGTEMTNGDGVVTPRVGSVYSSWEEVERMFKDYGKKKGFGVIRGQSAYYVGTKKKRAITMRCECYGCPDMKLKSDEKKRQKNMEVGGCSGEELKFEGDASPKNVVALLGICGMWRKEETERSGDANALLKYFDRMQTDNDKFFHSFRVDEKGTLKDVFWADARSRAAYEEFGDVVYTFEWVFRQWLKCIGGRAPDGILTDQAVAMRQPIKMYAELKEELLEVVYDSFTKEEFDTRLCEFGEKYVAAVERRIMQEKEADDKGHKYTRNLLTGIPLEKYFQRTYTDAKFRAFQRECERLIYCYVKEEIAKGDQIYSYVIEDLVWKTGKGGIHEYLTPKRRRKHAVVEVCYHDPAKTERTKRFDKMNAVFDALAFESCGCERTCDIVMKGLKRISDEVRSYNVVHVDEGGGMRGVGDIDSVHSSEPIGSNTQKTAVSGTLHGEQTQAPAPPTDNSSVNVVGQSEGSQPSVRIDVVAESGPGEQAATVVCGDPPIPKKKGRPKGTRYKSPGEKGWKKANENGSKNGGTGGKRKYQVCEVQHTDVRNVYGVRNYVVATIMVSVNLGCQLRFEFDRELKTPYKL